MPCWSDGLSAAQGARVAQFSGSVGVEAGGTWGPIPFIQRNHPSGSDLPPLPSYQALLPKYKKVSTCFVSHNSCGHLERLTTPCGPKDGETEALAGEVTYPGRWGAGRGDPSQCWDSNLCLHDPETFSQPRLG